MHLFSLNEFEQGVLDMHPDLLTVRFVLEAKEANFQRPPGAEKKAKEATYLKREYWFDHEWKLHYNVYLGVDDNEPYHHLKCTLTKTA